MTRTTDSTHPSPPFSCRVLHHHHWVQRSTEDGSRYEACRNCGKERPDAGGGGAANITF
jgi:hypothetical protein